MRKAKSELVGVPEKIKYLVISRFPKGEKFLD
jgi:hypothetical protein